MQYKLIYLITIFSFLILSSCSSLNYVEYETGINKDRAPFNYVISKAAKNTCPSYTINGQKYTYNYNVAVMSYVDTSDMKSITDLGRALTENLKDALFRECGVHVKEINLSKYIKVSKKGDIALSSNIKDLRDNLKIFYIYQGMYTVTPNQLIIYTRLIDLRTGNIQKSDTESIPINDEIMALYYNED